MGGIVRPDADEGAGGSGESEEIGDDQVSLCQFVEFYCSINNIIF